MELQAWKMARAAIEETRVITCYQNCIIVSLSKIQDSELTLTLINHISKYIQELAQIILLK